MKRDELDIEAEFGVPERGAGRGGGRKGRGGLLLFLVGLSLGVAGALLAPRLLGPYLPEALRGRTERVEGEVLAKSREGEQLLLTVETQPGAVLATFRRRVPEIDLLVGVGDTVALGMAAGYEPFVEDPAFLGVRKARAEDAARPVGSAEPGGLEEKPGAATTEDTLPAGAAPDRVPPEGRGTENRSEEIQGRE